MGLSLRTQQQLQTYLSSLDSKADTIWSQNFFNADLPIVGSSLNDLLDGDNSGRKWGDFLKLGDAVGDYFAQFDPASEHFVPANANMLPTTHGLRDALLDDFSFGGNVLFNTNPTNSGQPTVIITAGVGDGNDGDANGQLQFNVTLNAAGMKSVAVSLDSLGSSWTDLGLDLTAAATVNVNTAIDAPFSFGINSPTSGSTQFFNFNKFDVSAKVAANDATLGIDFGPFAGDITATKFELNAGARFTFNGGAANLGAGLNVESFLPPAAANMVDINLSVDPKLFGTSIFAVGAQPTVALVDNNIFDGLTAPPRRSPSKACSPVTR